MIRGSTQPLTSIPTQRFCSIFSDCRYCIRQESPGQCGGSSPQPLGGPCSSCGCDCRWGGGFGEWSCRPMEGLEVMWLRPLLIWNDWHLSHWLTLHESISVVSWMMLNVVDQYFFSKKLKLPSRPAQHAVQQWSFFMLHDEDLQILQRANILRQMVGRYSGWDARFARVWPLLFHCDECVFSFYLYYLQMT